MSSYWQPNFLTDDDQPTHRVRCAVHGFIHYSENERKVIDHWLFQRLRYIRQLALTELVYPGASHTRFEHSLGVMEVATRAFDTLATKHGDRLEANFRQVDGFQNAPMALARQVLRLAALLHDVGHASFSHAAEEVVRGGVGHEDLTLKIIEEDAFLGRFMDDLFGNECSRKAAAVLRGGRDLPPQLRVLRDLVSSQIDADRADYLVRDSLHCGVGYGRFDHLRLIDWNRDHHWLLHETGYDANAMDIRWSKEVLSVLKNLYPEREFIHSIAAGPIHKLLIPTDTSQGEWVILPLVERDGTLGHVGEKSQVLRSLPREFQCARIFADVRRDEESLRAEMRARAAHEWRQRGGR